MAQKKIEAIQAVEDKVTSAEENTPEGLFVDTFWNQYELRRERALELQEKREDAYLNAVREVIKFNKQYRESLGKMYVQTKKTNKDLFSELVHQFNSRKDNMKEEVKIVEEQASDREELKKQLKEVTGQLEQLALTPIKSIFEIVDQFEDNFEENAESSIAFARDSRNAWLQVRKQYVTIAKRTHHNLVERGTNSLKELIKV
ncbi:hypothetical protein [Neobacillus massiliamazoniensis]|uniref:Uncharacterized protein n=1 Tax=Neobacillus massiliamazoniensis TaxID=1499688 RepID=A0A0U1NRN2_9BACI|nr:hypothetical protein [Neobacillus massiliamazoniensis]CRK80710.1 hypothetical protein BN000_00598 [Neobacillus massiliamazoniensis]